MQNAIASLNEPNRANRSIRLLIQSCMLLIATIAALGASTLCLAAGQAEIAAGSTEVTARYLGSLKANSAVDADGVSPLLATPLTVSATPPKPDIVTFDSAEIGIGAGTAQSLTVSFFVSGYAGSFTPLATLHYGHDYSAGAVTCTPSGVSETCNVPVSFRPSLPGARKDALFLMDGTTRLATVLLGGVGEGPLSLVQPGAFSTTVPTNQYIYQSVTDENGVVYLLPNGNTPYIERVTKAGVASQIALTNPPYFWTISIDGAGVLYLFNETSTVTTYDTVQGIQGTYQIPLSPQGPDPTNDWFPGSVGVDGSIFVVDQISNNGVAYALRPNGTTAYAVTFNPSVLQPFTAAVDSDGNFFVGGYEIDKVTPAGVQTQVNTVGASEGLAVDAADTLYATRYNPTDGVAELPASSYATPIASFGRSSPLGMSLGSDGTLYISNYVNLDIFDRSTTETIDFGEVDSGTSSKLSTASVYNGGNQALSINGFTLSESSDAGFSLDFSNSNECNNNIVLAPGTLCQVSVVFAPTHPGTFSGTVSISSNSLNLPIVNQTIQLAGTTYGSYDVLSPSALVFAAQAPGTSKTLAVTMTNQGNYYPSTVYSLASDNPAFTIAQGTCAGVAVQVGSSCQLQVTFTPTEAQSYAGTATIVTYVAGTLQHSQTITLPLSGSVTGPVVATPVVTPGTGSYTSTQQVTITDSMPGATIYYSADGSSPSPSSTKYTGVITVSSNETLNALATATGYSQSSIASATYTFHEAVATVAPTSLAFGNQVEGIASVAQTVTLKNTGAGTLTLSGFSITGSTEFSQTNNCAVSLAAGSTCTLSIVYTPASLVAKSATLTINSDSIQAAPTVALTGSGINPPPATLSPGALTFGSQQIGSTSAAMTLTLSNPSSTALNFDSVSISGAASASFSQTNGCGTTIAAGANCTISVTFTPAGVGAVSAALAVVTRYPGFGPISISSTLSGTGAAPPAPTFMPSSLAFGNQVIQTSSASQTLTLTNPAAAGQSISISDILFSTAVGFQYKVVGCPASLAAGASCQIQVVFLPTSVTTFSGSVKVSYSYAGAPALGSFSLSASITGTGIAQPPVLTITPSTLAFGNQSVNTRSAARSVTVTNSSTTDTVSIGSVQQDGSSPFNLTTANCFMPLAPGASCSLSITFSPGAIQAYSTPAIVHVQPAPGCGMCASSYPAQTITLTGSGIAQPPVLTISPSTLAFGNQSVNTTSAARSVTVTNSSTTDTITIGSIQQDGSSPFNLTTANCFLPLAPGASCSVSIIFSPSAIQTYTTPAIVHVQPASGCGVCASSYPLQTIDLTGSGIAQSPVLTITPSTLAFGNQIVNTGGPALSITITNSSTTDTVNIGSIQQDGSSPFNLTSASCFLPLAPGANCTLSITFSPSAIQIYTTAAIVHVQPASGCGMCATSYPSQIITLTGTGVAAPTPVISINPAALSFGNQIQISTSAAQKLTISNTGKGSLGIFNISLTQELPGIYSQTNDCINVVIPQGGSCTITVTFSPTSTFSYPGTISILSNDPASPQTISLTGMGTITPDFVIASSTPAQVVLPGGSAQFSLTVTAQNGAKIPTVTLAASGLPPGATAIFSNSTVTPGSASAATTLTIKTLTRTSAKAAAIAGPTWPLATPVLALAGLFLVPAKRRRRWAAVGVLMIVALAGLGTLSGCGGSSLPPAKSYNVTITGTIGTVQQTTTVQLTVQ